MVKQDSRQECRAKLNGRKWLNHEVNIKLGELECIMDAASRTIDFIIQRNALLGVKLSVDDKDIISSYRQVENRLKRIRKDLAKDAIKKLKNG